MRKMASRKVFWHFLHANFFMFILLISNHMTGIVADPETECFFFLTTTARVARGQKKNFFKVKEKSENIILSQGK